MWEGRSLSAAARLAHTTPATVRKYAGTAVARTTEGRYAATAVDHIARPMRFLAPDGVIAIEVPDSRAATLIGEYWNAVNRYLRTGRADALRRFAGRDVRVGRRRHRFVTDPLTLDRLANAGEVRFEDLYALNA
jgi:hypothetical protein